MKHQCFDSIVLGKGRIGDLIRQREELELALCDLLSAVKSGRDVPDAITRAEQTIAGLAP